MIDAPTYPVFKGLQQPIEFMGLRGKFIYLAAGAIGGGFISFILFNIFISTLVGFIAALVVGGTLFVILLIKQHKGLYSRKKFRGWIIYHRLRVNHLV